VQGLAILAFIVRAPGGLAVDRDDVGAIRPQIRHPIGKALLEQGRIDRVQHIRQRVVARNIVAEGQVVAQEIEMLEPPLAHLDEVVGASDRGAHHEQHDLLQRIHDLGALARIGQSREMHEKRDRRGLWLPQARC